MVVEVVVVMDVLVVVGRIVVLVDVVVGRVVVVDVLVLAVVLVVVVVLDVLDVVVVVVAIAPIVNSNAFDVPPPSGAGGLNTVTVAVPCVAMSVAGIDARSSVLLTKVVVLLAPFHRTIASISNAFPSTINVNAGPPAGALSGERDAREGMGAWPFRVRL